MNASTTARNCAEATVANAHQRRVGTPGGFDWVFMGGTSLLAVPIVTALGAPIDYAWGNIRGRCIVPVIASPHRPSADPPWMKLKSYRRASGVLSSIPRKREPSL